MSEAAPAVWFDEIDSTQEEAKRRVRADDFGPVWIAARSQNGGRGRLGRIWLSPPGNLYTTHLFAEPLGWAQAARTPFVAALAVLDTFRSFAPKADIRLKWPNDVRIGGAKLSGILTETGRVDGGTAWVALGMGLNIAHVPDSVDQAAACLGDLCAEAPGPETVLETLRQRFEARRAQSVESFDALLRDWTANAEGLGQTVAVKSARTPVSGVFEGLAEDGGLILRLPSGAREIVRTGDVELVKEVSLDAARD